MPCLVVLFGVLMPRITLALLWFFTDWTRNVFNPWFLGLLGFLFLPYTTLAYVLIHKYSGAVTVSNVAHLIIILVAVVCDLGAWGGGRRHMRARAR